MSDFGGITGGLSGQLCSGCVRRQREQRAVGLIRQYHRCEVTAEYRNMTNTLDPGTGTGVFSCSEKKKPPVKAVFLKSWFIELAGLINRGCRV